MWYVWAVRIACWVIYVAVLTVLFMYVTPGSAGDRATWFKSLKRPDTGTSCCDISDCKRTRAKWVKGHWVADVWGFERVIPDNLVLSDPESLDGDAYVCASLLPPASKAQIFCFIPPNMAM